MRAARWCLLGLAAGLAARQAGAERSPRLETIPRRPALIHELTDDPQTKPTIQVYAKDRPLSEIVPSIGHELGMHFTVDADLMDEKATLFLDRRPGYEVMSTLSRQFNVQWMPTRGGYRLIAAPKRAERLAARREKDRAEQLELLRGWLDSISRLAREPEGRLAERQADLERQLAGGGLDADEQLHLTGERLILKHLFRPGSEPAKRAYAALTADQREDVLSGKGITLSLQSGEKTTVQLTDNPGPLLTPQEALPGRLRVEVRVESPAGSRSFVWSPLLPLDPPAPSTAEDSQDKQLNRFMILDPATLPAPPVSLLAQPEWQPNLMQFSDVIEAIRKQIGFEMVSDSFTRARLDPRLILGQRTARNALDTVAGQLNYTWKKDGNLITWHSRTDFREGPEEVPETELTMLHKRVSSLGGVNLNVLGEMAAKLDDEQMRGLEEYWGWHVEGSTAATTAVATTLWERRDDLRFWGTLAGERLRSASAGDFVPFRELAPLEQRMFVKACGAAVPEAESASGKRGKSLPLPIAGFQVDRTQSREQVYELTEAGKRKSRLTLRQAPDQPAEAFNPPSGAAPLGDPSLIDTYTFSYYVADRATPARVVSFDVPRVQKGEVPGILTGPRTRSKR